MESVGLRELRKDLGGYLQRAANGERIEVTDRNRPLAMIGPAPGSASDDIIERLVVEHGATRSSGSLLDIKPYADGSSELAKRAIGEISRDRDDRV